MSTIESLSHTQWDCKYRIAPDYVTDTEGSKESDLWQDT